VIGIFEWHLGVLFKGFEKEGLILMEMKFMV